MHIYTDYANNQDLARANLASAAYEVAAPHPPTKKAMAASDSQKTTPTYAPAIAAEAEVAMPDADENPVASVGHTTNTVPLQHQGDGRRTRQSTARQWAITAGQMQWMAAKVDLSSLA